MQNGGRRRRNEALTSDLSIQREGGLNVKLFRHVDIFSCSKGLFFFDCVSLTSRACGLRW